jgi:hypothetical protein
VGRVSGSPRTVRWLHVALAVPGCTIAAAFTMAVMMGLFGRHPMWAWQPLNLAEAAALRDRAEVSRLIEFAADPNVPQIVRAGVLFDYPVKLTPLEAAVVANDDTMVRHLLNQGAFIDVGSWNRLQCLAEGDDVRRVIEEVRPSGSQDHCPERIEIGPAIDTRSSSANRH